MTLRIAAYLIQLVIITLGISAGAWAQAGSLCSLSGRVTDADSGQPLENVIAFLMGTPFGGSTRADGTFRIDYLPAGEYELVVSRLGYRRQIIPVKLDGGDSLYFRVGLVPQPIKQKGIEVRAERFAPESKMGLIFPRMGPDSYTVFGTRESTPLGVLFLEHALYIYSLDTALIDSEKYLRVWILYANQSESPEKFDVMRSLRLHVASKNHLYRDIPPEPAGVMLERVTEHAARAQLAGRVDATFNALELFQKLIKPGIFRTGLPAGQQNVRRTDAESGTNPDRSGKLRITWDFTRNPALKGMSSAYLSTLYKRSVHAGILGNYTIYPDNCVDGYAYFPFPGLSWKAQGEGFDEAFGCKYQLEILTPEGSRIIDFVPG